ncbi:hypothetical protein [Altererythrobacter lauratis]|uniref:Uncharacterized protein n=1 Tax=Alteraurantiacibacter lauratis TaxID=2054627 RepID=A0ABV7EDU5_9SPHN
MTGATDSPIVESRLPLSVGRLSLTGALSLFVVYAACWAGATVGVPVTHAFIGLFTSFAVGSLAALCVGGAWALLAGGFTGAVVAAIYNMVKFMEPPSAK